MSTSMASLNCGLSGNDTKLDPCAEVRSPEGQSNCFTWLGRGGGRWGCSRRGVGECRGLRHCLHHHGALGPEDLLPRGRHDLQDVP